MLHFARSLPRRFRGLIVTFEMCRLNLNVYSLRRGGATHLFRETGNFDVVVARGRWAQISTARQYINESMADCHEWHICSAKELVERVLKSEIVLHTPCATRTGRGRSPRALCEACRTRRGANAEETAQRLVRAQFGPEAADS